MDERSTLNFRSNLYPTSTGGSLVSDRRFLDSISDPEALDLLWRYNGTRGSLLNKLQEMQHKAAIHCRYADEGDYPWGTPIGENRVVCLCDQIDCPRHKECLSGKTVADEPISTIPPRAVKTINVTVAAGSASVSNGSRTVGPSGGQRVPYEPWTDQEIRLLKSACQSCTREYIYVLFPRRSKADIDARISLLGLTPASQMKTIGSVQTRSGRQDGKAASGTTTSPKQKSSKRKRKRKGDSSIQVARYPSKEISGSRSRQRSWSYEEDRILRENYPQYGANMSRWKEKLQGKGRMEIIRRAKDLGLEW